MPKLRKLFSRTNWLVAVSQHRSEFPCLNLNMQPFVEKIEIDENNCEYHASSVDFFSMDAAYINFGIN
jgi:hypothetical protein